jgi:hypothetical protein
LPPVVSEKSSGPIHQFGDCRFIDRRRTVWILAAGRFTASLVGGRAGTRQPVQLVVEVAPRIVLAVSTDEENPRAGAALEGNDDPVRPPQVLYAQLLQWDWPGDAIAERCAATPVEIVEERLVNACCWSAQASRLGAGEGRFDNLDEHR